ncbi:MAG TPA: tetratricopeptide repeat protein, partial [Verrucomicrobiae bacterium]|nr:tetratricopeptide repeat protein [Verrucomicrobiae bacterium]
FKHHPCLAGARLLLLFWCVCVIQMPPRSACAAESDAPAASDTKPGGARNAGAWSRNRNAGRKARDNGQIAEAERSFRAALAEAENFGPTDRRVAESLQDLGALFGATDNLVEAETLLRRATLLRRNDVDPSAEADCLLDFAVVCQKLGKYDDAESACERGQQVLERKLGVNAPPAIICVYHLALVYDAQHKDAQAEPLFKQAVHYFLNPAQNTRDPLAATVPNPQFPNRRLDSYGGQSLRYAVYQPMPAYAIEALNHLGELCVRDNRPSDAASFFEQALTLMENEKDKGSTLMDFTLASLVDVYVNEDNFPEAEKVLKRAIKLKERSESSKNRTIFNPEARLAAVYEKEHKSSEAEDLYKTTLATEEKRLGADSDEAFETLRALGKLYLAQADYEKAEPVYRRLVARTEKFQGGSVALLPLLSDQAILYIKLGRDSDLEAVYRRQIAAFEQMFGANSKTVVKPLSDCALLLRKRNRDAEAEQLEARVKAIHAADDH